MPETASFTAQIHTDLQLMVVRTIRIAHLVGIQARPAVACSRLHRPIEYFGWPMAGTSRVRPVHRLTMSRTRFPRGMDEHAAYECNADWPAWLTPSQPNWPTDTGKYRKCGQHGNSMEEGK